MKNLLDYINNEKILLKYLSDVESTFSKDILDYLLAEIFVEKIYDFTTDTDIPIIIDCGANIGLSIIFFKLKYPEAIIHAFEPDPSTFNILKNNIRKYNFTDVHIYNKALSDRNGIQSFFISNEKNTLNIPIMSLYKNELATKEINVETVNLGEFIIQFSKVDFCKMDVEGAESQLLNSLIQTGSLVKINALTVEYHKWVEQLFSMDEFIQKMERNNFSCKVIKNEEPHKDYSTSGNAILRFNQLIK